jgi:chromosome segregation and condensation protein ScpB
MDLVLRIPGNLAARLGATSDLSRQALETLAAEAYRAGRLTRPELRRFLGFGTRRRLTLF